EVQRAHAPRVNSFACRLVPLARPSSSKRSESDTHADERPVHSRVPGESAVLIVVADGFVAGEDGAFGRANVKDIADCGDGRPGELRRGAEPADVSAGDDLKMPPEIEGGARADGRVNPILRVVKRAKVIGIQRH